MLWKRLVPVVTEAEQMVAREVAVMAVLEMRDIINFINLFSHNSQFNLLKVWRYYYQKEITFIARIRNASLCLRNFRLLQDARMMLFW